jgi:predicted DNA-binding transcriptional regulator YafY
MLQQIAQQLGAKFQEPNLKLQDKLVFSFSALNDDGQSLQMAATCLQAIEQQYLLQFLYQSAFGTYKSRLQVVAPLQVRFYEGRFYLVACEWSERQKAPKQQIKVFAFDLIENYVAVPALAEREDGAEGELQHFSWQQMAQEVELKTHFKHCLGIARFKESIPELIRLKFTDWAISYVKSRRLHSSQRIVVDNPNYIVVELYIYRTYELSMLLSRFRDFGSEVR